MNIVKLLNAINKKLSVTSSVYKHTGLIRDLVCSNKNFALLATGHSVLSFYNRDTVKYGEEIIKYITDKRNWYTFDKCTSLDIYTKKNKIFAAVSIYDGDSMYGHPTVLRFRVETELPLDFVEMHFSELIDYYTNKLAERMYEDELESAKLTQIKKIKNKIIEDTNE